MDAKILREVLQAHEWPEKLGDVYLTDQFFEKLLECILMGIDFRIDLEKQFGGRFVLWCLKPSEWFALDGDRQSIYKSIKYSHVDEILLYGQAVQTVMRSARLWEEIRVGDDVISAMFLNKVLCAMQASSPMLIEYVTEIKTYMCWLPGDESGSLHKAFILKPDILRNWKL